MSTDLNPTIVIAVDDAYVVPGAALLTSMGRNGMVHDIDVQVFYCQLSDASRGELLKAGSLAGLTRLTFREFLVPNLPLSWHYSPTMYLRLHVGDLADVHRLALYLDVDTVVLKSLRPLLQIPLRGQMFGASRDIFIHIIDHRLARVAAMCDIGVPYFNSGVMLIDTNAWRQKQVARQTIDLLDNHPWLRLRDQDALNVLFSREWRMLDPEWNVMPSPYENSPLYVPLLRRLAAQGYGPEYLAELERRANILHYVGPIKPWHANFPPGFSRSRFYENLPEWMKNKGHG